MVCLLKKKPNNKRLDFGAGVDEKEFPRASFLGNQLYSDILLENFIIIVIILIFYSEILL